MTIPWNKLKTKLKLYNLEACVHLLERAQQALGLWTGILSDSRRL